MFTREENEIALVFFKKEFRTLINAVKKNNRNNHDTRDFTYGNYKKDIDKYNFISSFFRFNRGHINFAWESYFYKYTNDINNYDLYIKIYSILSIYYLYESRITRQSHVFELDEALNMLGLSLYMEDEAAQEICMDFLNYYISGERTTEAPFWGKERKLSNAFAPGILKLYYHMKNLPVPDFIKSWEAKPYDDALNATSDDEFKQAMLTMCDYHMHNIRDMVKNQAGRQAFAEPPFRFIPFEVWVYKMLRPHVEFSHPVLDLLGQPPKFNIMAIKDPMLTEIQTKIQARLVELDPLKRKYPQWSII